MIKRTKTLLLILFLALIIPKQKSFGQEYICVSTDPVSGQITFSWNFSNASGDYNFFTLQWSLTKGDWNDVDSVVIFTSSGASTYTIANVDGNKNRYYFRLYGERINTTGIETWPTSIFLTMTEMGSNVVKLDWNYDWTNSSGIHYLQRLENGVWNTIYSIPFNINNEYYSYTDLLPGLPCNNTETKYRIWFDRGAGGCPSISNIVSRMNPCPPPDTVYITQVSVLNSSAAEIGYYYSPPDRVSQLVLERADNPSGPYSPIDTLTSPPESFLPQQGSFTDTSANVMQQSYFYRTSLFDYFNNTIKYSDNISRTILLKCPAPATQVCQLEWNEYSDWYNGVKQYEIFRILDGNYDSAAPLTTITGTSLNYADDISSFPPSMNVCYFIRAAESPGNPVVPNSYSVSNISCAMRDPVFNMPNAFMPEGTNNKFRPVQSFIDSESFLMQIYNKWGKMIYETSDIDTGWNGTIEGDTAPADLYVYCIRYKSLQGKEYEKRGTVLLIR